MDRVSDRELYRIGDLLLDGAAKTLYRGGQVVPLAYRSAQLLLELARAHPNVVRRIDLIESVWPTEDVTDQALSQRVSLLRKELGDTADKPKYIGRRWGWGYHLLVPVERLTEAPARTEGPPTPVSPGSRLGPYEILGALGSGGMGEVYRARDTRLGREVAIKVLPAEYAKDPDRLRRFEREAQAAAAPKHPNILVLYDIGTQDGAPYLVTELLDGETLRKALESGPMPPARVVELGVQIARGLAAAHEKGVIHRDLQPDNLFLTVEGPVKILDFGLARLRSPEGSPQDSQKGSPNLAPSTQEGQVVGTPGYMSPEQLRGLPADARSDLFALGCVLYEMVSGRRPFAGATPADEAAAILKESPPDLQEEAGAVPAALDLVIRRCLEKDPAERFQSAKDLAFALETLSGASGVISGAEAPARAAPGRLAISRRTLALASACAALALAAAVAAGFLIHRAMARPSLPVFHQISFRRGAIAGAGRFTPDGKDVIYSGNWDGNPGDIFSVRPGRPETRSLGLGPSQLVALFPNGDALIRVLADQTLAVAPLNGGAPREILEDFTYADAGPDPQHVLVVRSESGKSRIEYPIGKVILQAPGEISYPRLSHKGDRVAFVQGEDLMLADLEGKAVTLSKGPGLIIGVAWSPGDEEVWFTGGRKEGWALYAVRPGGRERPVYIPPVMIGLSDIAADGRVLLFRELPRYGFVVGDTKTGEERDLSWFNFGNLGRLSSDGSQVLFHEGAEMGGEWRRLLCIRKTDGSPPIELGEGCPRDLSPDGEWVLAVDPKSRYGKPRQLYAIPTGTGQPKPLTKDALNHQGGLWMPDGKRFVFYGNEPEKKPRFWIQSVEGGTPKPLTPEGHYRGMALSPDGRDLAYWDEDKGGIFLVSTVGGPPRPVPPGEPKGLWPVRFSADGRALYGGLRKIWRIDIATGQRTLVREIKPADPAGFFIQGIDITPDEKTYAYYYFREISDWLIVEGLK